MEQKKVDYDLDAPAIELVYCAPKNTVKSQVLPHFEKSASQNGAALTYAAGTKQEVLKIEGSSEWFVIIHPTYEQKDEVYDFAYSDVFYKWCTKKGPKIIYDGFSESRAKALFPKFTDIERHFRGIIIKKGVDLDAVKDKNRGSGNHLVSWLETSELFGTIFLQKASEKYFLETLTRADTDEKRLAAYNATVADECGFGEHVDFFKNIHKLRNKIMHGRIITAEEYKKAVDDIDKLETTIKADMFVAAFDLNPILWENLSQTIKQAQEAALAIFEAAKPQLDFAQEISRIIQPQANILADIGATITKNLPRMYPGIEAAQKAAIDAARTLITYKPPVKPEDDSDKEEKEDIDKLGPPKHTPKK
jgi:hypothetical protein